MWPFRRISNQETEGFLQKIFHSLFGNKANLNRKEPIGKEIENRRIDFVLVLLKDCDIILLPDKIAKLFNTIQKYNGDKVITH